MLNTQKNNLDDVSEQDHEAYQISKEEMRQPLHDVQAWINKHMEDMKGILMWSSIDIKNNPVGVIRILFLNPNTFPLWSRDNYKVDRLKFMMKEYNPETVGLQVLCQNSYASKTSMTVADMLQTRERVICLVTPHKQREGRKNVGNYKVGGMTIVLRDCLSFYAKDSGTYHTGLGWWS